MKIEITEKHLDKALSVTWDSQTCIVAQAVSEAFGKSVKNCGATSVSIYNIIPIFRFNTEDNSRDLVNEIQNLFDVGHSQKTPNPSKIAELRKMLPLTININE